MLNGYECKNLVEYRKSFLNKMKSLLPYLVEFFEDKSMLPKECLNGCIVYNLDQNAIIMIMYNKNILFVNDDY